jgi:hypothetical protein
VAKGDGGAPPREYLLLGQFVPALTALAWCSLVCLFLRRSMRKLQRQTVVVRCRRDVRIGSQFAAMHESGNGLGCVRTLSLPQRFLGSFGRSMSRRGSEVPECPLRLHGRQQWSAAQNGYYAFDVVGEHIKRHLSCYLASSPHQKVRRTHPALVPNGCSAVFRRKVILCRSIIEAHSGRLWAISCEPRAALFQFLPPDRTDRDRVDVALPIISRTISQAGNWSPTRPVECEVLKISLALQTNWSLLGVDWAVADAMPQP